MDQAEKTAFREGLMTVSALKASMEQALRSDPSNDWKHSSYRHYMRKYMDVVRYVQQLGPVTAPVDSYDLNNVPRSGDTVAPVQKELFESVHANLAILEAWLKAKVDLPAEKAEDLRHFVEANLRKAIFEIPSQERDVQNALEQLFIGRGLVKGVDYDRETGRVKVSIKETIPDFILPKLSLAVEVKLAKTELKSKIIVDEINADIQAYGQVYERLLFVVYDLGTIRDTTEFSRGLEVTTGTEVIVVKH
jgi:hypothetical protein